MNIQNTNFLTENFNLSHAMVLSIGVHLLMFPLLPMPSKQANTDYHLKKKWKPVHIEILKKIINKPVVKKETQIDLPKVVLARQIKPLKIEPEKVTQKVPETLRASESVAIKQVQVKPISPQRATTSKVFTPTQKFRHIQNVSRVVQLAPIRPSIAPTASSEMGKVKFVAKFQKSSVKNYSGTNSLVAPVKMAQASVNNKNQATSHKARSLGYVAVSRLSDNIQPRKINTSVKSSRKPGSGIAKFINSPRLARLSFTPQPKQMAKLKPVKENDALSKEAIKKIWSSYASSIRDRIGQKKKYPKLAKKKGWQGEALIAFQISKLGEILKVSVESSSGHEILDEAALKAIKKAGPYPPIPNQLNRQAMLLKMPITFILR